MRRVAVLEGAGVDCWGKGSSGSMDGWNGIMIDGGDDDESREGS